MSREEDAEILEGFAPDTPFGEALEEWLDATGGPIQADVDAARSAASRMSGTRPGRLRRAATLLAIAAAAVAVVLSTTREPATQSATDPAARAWSVVLQAPGASFHRAVDGALRVEGSVRLPGSPAGGRVEVGPWVIEAEEGADWVVGTEAPFAAVGVLDGRVHILGVGDVPAGEWRLTDGTVLVAFDGARPPDRSTLSDPEAARGLVTQLRWLALPERTRAGVAP